MIIPKRYALCCVLLTTLMTVTGCEDRVQQLAKDALARRGVEYDRQQFIKAKPSALEFARAYKPSGKMVMIKAADFAAKKVPEDIVSLKPDYLFLTREMLSLQYTAVPVSCSVTYAISDDPVRKEIKKAEAIAKDQNARIYHDQLDVGVWLQLTET